MRRSLISRASSRRHAACLRVAKRAIPALLAVGLLAGTVPTAGPADAATFRFFTFTAVGQTGEVWALDSSTNDPAALWPTDERPEGSVYFHRVNGGDYQKWRFTLAPRTTNEYVLRNVATGLCLDSADQYGEYKVYTYVCNGGQYQRWVITPATLGSAEVRLTNKMTGVTLPTAVDNYYEIKGDTLVQTRVAATT